MFDIIYHHIRERTHIRSNDRNGFSSQNIQSVDKCTCRSYDRCRESVSNRFLMQVHFRNAMITTSHTHNGNQTGITHNVHVSIRKLQSTFETHSVHSLEFFFGYFFHPHPARMESKTLW